MHNVNRRTFVSTIGISAAAAGLGIAAEPAKNPWRLATFSVDVTPRIGHPLLGHGFAPATGIDDPLLARGLVLTGGGPPIVMVSIDWCELRNDAHDRWRAGLAKAANTTIDRVLVSCIHQHDAPYFDLTAQKILAGSKPGGLFCDVDFHEHCVERVGQAVASAIPGAQPVTHVGLGQATVEQIASNRRVVMPDGKINFHRYSTCRDSMMRSLPEGEIDPWLKTVSFYSGDRTLAALSMYATHPMSYYGTGRISGDFVNVARDRRQSDDPGVFQIYVTGCCGDVTAGKFNDGSRETRPLLAERLYQAMRSAADATKRHTLTSVACRSVPMTLPYSELPTLSREVLEAKVNDPSLPLKARADAALGLSTLVRNPKGLDVDVQAIDFGVAQIVLLPAESFVAYQLQAQRLKPDEFVMAIGFGQSAAGYLPTDQGFREGFREQHGYCWVAPGSEQIMLDAIKKVLS